MEVALPGELQAKLETMAAQQGCSVESLIVEAVRRAVDYDSWFQRQIEAGIASAHRGDLIDHEDIRKMIEERYRP